MSKDDPTTFYAYGELNAGIEAVMRLHSVKRWHMIDSTRTQTLAEHSANVAVLAGYIAATAPEMYFGAATVVRGEAVIHDMPEVFTGDVPTPTKKHIVGLAQLEHKVLPDAFKSTADVQVHHLIKICDLADGIRFIRLHGVDVTAIHARTGLERQLKDKMHYSETNWPRPVHDHVYDKINFYAYR